MAKATLPTNYKDDIMATPMGGLRRYRPIQNDDGTVSFEDVTDYMQVGSNFGAAQMNQTNTAVNNSADKSRIIDSLADVAANTQAGMMAGALAVRELNGKLLLEKQEWYLSYFGYNAMLVKSGNTKQLIYWNGCQTILTAGTSYKIATLPEEYRPNTAQSQKIDIVADGGNEVFPARFDILANGELSISPLDKDTKQVSCAFSIIWI